MASVITDPSHLDRLIDRQVKLWDVRQQLAEEGGAAARREFAHLPQGPWITMSMQLGSAGRELAARLEHALGWQVFDKEILAAVAERTRWRDRILAGLDEKAVRPFAEYVAHLIVPDHLGQPEFHREMLRVVGAIAHRGRAILLGRGANWFLDSRYGLRLRVVAPREARIDTHARLAGIPRAEAVRIVDQDDARRSAFIRQLYRREIEDPLGYDLVLNLGALDLDAAEETALTALRRKLGGAPGL